MNRRTGRYQLAVAYRIYPKISKTPIVFPDDKLALSELCLDSFARSLRGVRAKLYAILDGCPLEYEALFRQYFPSEDLEIIRVPGIGNAGTFERQIEILGSQDDSEHVFLAEDDYAYHPGALEKMLRFMASTPGVDFVTPYDHPDYHELELHSGCSTIEEFDGIRWMTAATTCLTFLSTRGTLRQAGGSFGTYSRGNRDSSLWLSLTKERVFDPLRMLRWRMRDPDTWKHYSRAWRHGWRQHLAGRKWNLWAPVPSLATHMESTGIAPGFDWEASLDARARHLKLPRRRTGRSARGSTSGSDDTPWL